MSDKKLNILDTKIFFGLAIIIFGVLLLLENFGISVVDNPWSYWPVLPLIIGLGYIFQPKEYRQLFTGLLLSGIGIVFLIANLDLLPDFKISWQLIIGVVLLFIGLQLLYQTVRAPSKPSATENFINLSAIMGGGGYNFSSKNLEGGKITAILGGCELDLREAQIEKDSIIIDVFTLFGGVEIKIPKEWQVIIKGTAILGGIDNKAFTHPAAESKTTQKKSLIVKGFSMFGGVEIKN